MINKDEYEFLHDLTNKLSKIDGYSEMLKSTLGDEHEILLKIEKANSEAIELIKKYKKNLEQKPLGAAPSFPLFSDISDKKKCYVLVADDEEDLRDILHLILTRFGLIVSTANDGQTALEMSKKNHFDLIISDMKMPLVDGFSFLEQLRADKNLHQPKFLFISGGLDVDQDKMKFIKDFSDGTLAKPFLPNLIFEKINELFPGHFLKKE